MRAQKQLGFTIIELVVVIANGDQFGRDRRSCRVHDVDDDLVAGSTAAPVVHGQRDRVLTKRQRDCELSRGVGRHA